MVGVNQSMIGGRATPPKLDGFPRQTPMLISYGLDSRQRLEGTGPHSPYVGVGLKVEGENR